MLKSNKSLQSAPCILYSNYLTHGFLKYLKFKTGRNNWETGSHIDPKTVSMYVHVFTLNNHRLPAFKQTHAT